MRSRAIREAMHKPKRSCYAGGGSADPYEAEAAREQKYWEGYSATHNPADKYEDVDKSSLAGLTDKLAGAGNDYGKQYQGGYDKFVGADQSKSNAIRNQSINTPMGNGGNNGKPNFDVQAMRDRAAAKAAGRTAPQVDRRGDAYKAAADAQNNAYRDQSMKETQQDKRRSGAFNSEMHDQRVKRNSDMQAADLTRHGYKQGADGNWNRSVWDQMQDSNPALTKAFGWIPGAKNFTEAGAKGDVGGMISAGQEAYSGAKNMADTAGGYMDKGKGYIDKAKSAVPGAAPYLDKASQALGRRHGGSIPSPTGSSKRRPNLSLRYRDK